MSASLDIDYPNINNGFMSFGQDGGKGPQYYELAAYMVKELGLKTIGNYNWIYDIDAGHYKLITDQMLEKKIIELTQEKAKPSWLSSFFKVAKAKSQIERSIFESPPSCLNVANGVLDIKRKILVDHDKSFNFKYITPIKYDPNAKCPTFMDFLNFVFEGNQELINVTGEIFGYCLLGGDPFLHKSIVLLGDGRNGKSTWLHVLRKLLGDDNCSSVSMGLLNKPFSAVRLDGKLANITGELPTGKLDSELFKSAVGGEYITAAHKGKDEYGLHVRSRFIFACNDMPKFGDATTGMWEKLYIIPFNRYIREDERDPGIFTRLETELPGVLNFALDGLAVLLKRQKLPKIQAVQDLMTEYREESDSVYDYFNEKVIVDNKYQYDRILNKKLHNHYALFCSGNGRHAVNDNQFSKRLRRILKEREMLNVTVKTGKGREGRWYSGLSVPDINNLMQVLR